ncbi:MAG: hypothetical protein KDD70_15445, partial [Bdellovibrionales bacterium]|nr:hypothetical protein [Bdellovibrionales bacterium]
MLKVRSSAVDLSPVIDHYTLMFKNTFNSFPVLLLVFVLFASNVVAQSEECGIDHPELCNFDVALFCQRQGDVNLNFALDID